MRKPVSTEKNPRDQFSCARYLVFRASWDVSELAKIGFPTDIEPTYRDPIGPSLAIDCDLIGCTLRIRSEDEVRGESIVRSAVLGAVLSVFVVFQAWAQVRRVAVNPTQIAENANPDQVVVAPGQNPVGVAWGNGLLWVVDSEERLVFPVAPRSGEVVKPAIPLLGFENPGPAAFDAMSEALWVIDNPGARVLRSVQELRSPEPRLARIPIHTPAETCFIPITRRARTGVISGVGWDGVGPWFCMRGGLCAALIRIDLANDFDINLATSAGCDPIGLAIDPDYKSLWVATQKNESGEPLLLERSLVDQRDPFDRPVSVLSTKRCLMLDPAVRVTAITADRQSIWVLDAGRRRIYRFNVF